MGNNCRGRSTGFFWGMLVVAIGVIFLLDNMGIVSAHYVFQFFWPVIFIFFGIEGILFCSGPGRFWGSFLMLAGVVLLLSNFGYLHVRWSLFWPLAMILSGLWMLSRSMGGGGRWEPEWARRWAKRAEPGSVSDSPDLQSDVVFSAVNRRITSKNFKGGKVAAIFGEFKIDLTEADIEGDVAVIHLDAVFGAVEIRVPNTWNVSSHGAGVFGEYADRTFHGQPSGSGTKRLIVNGGAVFGSVVIKN